MPEQMVFGFHKKGSTGVGCYGKLPRHGDYVSHASDGVEARWLTAWLDAGYRLTGGDDDRDAAETRFVLPAGRRALCGAIWPSADASGTRRFPFALFAGTAAKTLAPLGSRVPLGLARGWSTMSAAMPPLLEADSPDAIRKLLVDLEIPDPPGISELDDEFSRGASDSLDLGGAIDVLFDLDRLAGMLSTGKRGVAPAFAVLIPLRTSYAPELEATAWLEVLSRRLDAANLSAESRIFVRPSRGDTEGALYVIHRELKEADLGFILSPADDYPYGNVLGLPGEDAASFREWFTKTAGPSPTLDDLVELDLSSFEG